MVKTVENIFSFPAIVENGQFLSTFVISLLNLWDDCEFVVSYDLAPPLGD